MAKLEIKHVLSDVRGSGGIDEIDVTTYYAFVDQHNRIWEQRSKYVREKDSDKSTWRTWWEAVVTLPTSEEEAGAGNPYATEKDTKE